MSPVRREDRGSCTRCVLWEGKYWARVSGGRGWIAEGGGRGKGKGAKERRIYFSDMSIINLLRDADFDCLHHFAGRDDDSGDRDAGHDGLALRGAGERVV